MDMNRFVHRISAWGAVILTAALLSFTGLSAASAAAPSGASAAALAAANVGKSAGTCANTPSYNTLGGAQFETSCSGGGSGGPEYWCADFAQWVWANSGFSTAGLNAGAASFQQYGQQNGTQHTQAGYQPQLGDAIEYASTKDSLIHHVAVVTALNADGSVTTANGDWNGDPSTTTMAAWAVSSQVVSITIPASELAVGSQPSSVDPADGYYIAGYTTPVAASSNPYTPTAVCGAGFSVVDSHSLGGAEVYLLYSGATQQNCVTTMVNTPTGPVSLNATLSVQGGASASNPGSYTYYAGPVTLAAPAACVMWGGTYQGTTWTSGWSHCG
ncbi:CHAP domain-containing protein [Kitasatospora sp. NBC_01266]|uniref:CHAP domain-containing protein n=1 Tax=Kitasatospora sp. NBC_01266 TaxID=2903572 RepID=UPI002E36EA92|nr:CHAP domain-containing protein [Kitasatospora sp. NBC_01266]